LLKRGVLNPPIKQVANRPVLQAEQTAQGFTSRQKLTFGNAALPESLCSGQHNLLRKHI
jgi:hypothetical protein